MARSGLSAEAQRAMAEATKQSTLSFWGGVDCFAEPCHRARIRATRWLAKTWMGPISQHDTPSLRGALATKQSTLSLFGGMDFFSALAMTGMGPICQHNPPSFRA